MSDCAADVTLRLLADIDANGVATRVFEDRGIDEPIDDEHVGGLQVLLRLEGDEVRFAGAAANQRDAARRFGLGSACVELVRELAVGDCILAGQHRVAPGSLQQRFPGAPTQGRVGDGVLHAPA